MLQQQSRAGLQQHDGQGHDFAQTNLSLQRIGVTRGDDAHHAVEADTLQDDTMQEEGEEQGATPPGRLPLQVEPLLLATAGVQTARPGSRSSSGRVEEIESELEALRQGEITERAAAAHQHECSARAYEAARLHVGRAEGLRLRIMELEWQRNAVRVLDGARPYEDCFQEPPGSPWE